MDLTPYLVSKRAIDLVVSVVSMVVLSIPILLIALAVRLTSPGPAIYWSDRIGKDNRVFRMPKFRTMGTDTPDVATHLLNNPQKYITPLGKVLRKSSLDELPQIWSILRGDMSLVGPRPALYNQDDLVRQRSEAGVDKLRPGLTGWAQINGRDEIPLPQKVRLDIEYMNRRSLIFDLKIIALTFSRALRLRDVSH